VSAAIAVDGIRDAVRGAAKVLPRGAGTKPGLSAPGDDATPLDAAGLRGITGYDPGELTFTALAGTPIADLEATLGEHGQHLPFDPPLAAAGATLGGAVASGVPGPNAFGNGVVRDFVIGAKVIDGRGRVVSGGGRVVKNAAGFDLPKLMVGSAGRLGVIVELSCKVFPRPDRYATVVFEPATFAASLAALGALARGPVALVALELAPPTTVTARLAGAAELLDQRVARLRELVDAPSLRIDPDAEAPLWEEARELAWAPAGAAVLAVPTALGELPALERALAPTDAPRRYGLGGGLAWIAWSPARPVAELTALLAGLGLTGIALRAAPSDRALLGARPANAFAERVRAAIDPDRKFLEV